MTVLGDWPSWVPPTDQQIRQVGTGAGGSVERVSYLIAVASTYWAESKTFNLDVFEVISEEPEPQTQAWFGDIIFGCSAWADVPAMAEERLEPTDYRVADGAAWMDEGDRWVVRVVGKGRG